MFRRWSITILAVVGVLALVIAAPMQAQNRPGARQQHHAGEWLRKYKDLSPAQQQKALDSDPQFRNLPPARQQALRRRLQWFSSLPPERQRQVLDRMETLEHLTPDQKQDARRLFAEFRELPPMRRRLVRQGVQELRQTPVELRQQVIDSERFRKLYTPQELALLRGVAELPLAPAGGEPGMESETPSQ